MGLHTRYEHGALRWAPWCHDPRSVHIRLAPL